MKYFILVLSIFLLSSCETTKQLIYKKDKLFSSGYARKPEALATINGKPCKSMGDEIGNCYPSIKKGTDIIIKVPPHPYAYDFHFICTSSLGINNTKTILKNKENIITIPASKFEDIYAPTCDNSKVKVDVFNCEGHIFPLDTDSHPQVSKFFSIRFAVYNKDYQSPPEISIQKLGKNEYFVYGQNALYGQYIVDGKLKKTLHKNTYLKISEKNVDIKTWSCTASDRCNYYGY